MAESGAVSEWHTVHFLPRVGSLPDAGPWLAGGSMNVALALDVGGTHIKFGVVDRKGAVLLFREKPTAAGAGRAALQELLHSTVEDLLLACKQQNWRAKAVGMGFPGTIGGAAGVVLTAPPQIPGVEGLRFVPLLRKAASLPAVALNDADAAGYGEARTGAGRGKDPVLLVTVGTGLGGALVLGGRLVTGRFGTGGEIGQTVFQPNRAPGPLGGASRLEYHASASALVRLYRRAGGDREAQPREIVKRARRGELRARSALRRVGASLGLGLASAAMLVAPQVIVIGGGLSGAGRLLLDPARESFEASALPMVVKGCRLVLARLGNRAGIVGAGLLALEHAASAK